MNFVDCTISLCIMSNISPTSSSKESNYAKFLNSYGREEINIIPLSSLIVHLSLLPALNFWAGMKNVKQPKEEKEFYRFYLCSYHAGKHPWTLLPHETSGIGMPDESLFVSFNNPDEKIQQFLSWSVALEFDFCTREQPAALRSIQRNHTIFLYTIVDRKNMQQKAGHVVAVVVFQCIKEGGCWITYMTVSNSQYNKDQFGEASVDQLYNLLKQD